MPPESATIVALTLMIYAIAKNVANAAQNSVKKKEFGRTLFYTIVNAKPTLVDDNTTYMARSLETEITPHSAGRDGSIGVVNPAHLGEQFVVNETEL